MALKKGLFCTLFAVFFALFKVKVALCDFVLLAFKNFCPKILDKIYVENGFLFQFFGQILTF